MPRFYWAQLRDLLAAHTTTEALVTHQSLRLPKTIAHHIKVLRLKPSDTIIVFADTDCVWQAQLLEVKPDCVSIHLQAPLISNTELPYRTTLVQALPEGRKMDWIIEKTVELGLCALQPVRAARSVSQADTNRVEKKSIHWQQIALAALEQSGRTQALDILPLMSLAQWVASQLKSLQTTKESITVFASPRADMTLVKYLTTIGTPCSSLTIVIGPEGGFTAAEEQQLSQCAQAVSLGPRILRTETAGIVALAQTQALWGEGNQ